MPKLKGVGLGAKINDYLLLFVSLTAIFSAVVYYIYELNWVGIIVSLILTVVAFIFSVKLFGEKNSGAPELDRDVQTIKNKKISAAAILLIVGYGLTYLFLALELIKARSDRALISPWQTINGSFFWLYALASLLLILIIIKKAISRTARIILISLHYLISFAVAVIVYKIGYGFDPFIHRATMELIAAKGLVLPKPPYYLGEYGLIIILHKISGVAIELIDKILVPGLAALFLPFALILFLKTDAERVGADVERTVSEKRTIKDGQNKWMAIFLTTLFLLALTFSPFILTTPQNLSYLFLILSVLAGLNGARPLRVFILALATAAIHPLTGLPAIAWAVWVLLAQYRHRLKPTVAKIITGLIFIFTVLSLPLTLFWSNGRTWATDNFWSTLWSPFRDMFANLGTAGRENWLLNFVYFVSDNYVIFIILVIAAALIYFYRRRQNSTKEKFLARGLIMINIALLAAYLLTNRISFNELINYEQGNYADRLLIIILIFFLPFIFIGLKNLITKILAQNAFIKISWLIVGIGLLSVSLYLSYPRFDKYFNSHGYSTSASDIAAVKLADQNASGPYIALADQQVSAAALRTFGFDHYYSLANGQIYFYPVPTGGPLYQYYLDMVYKNPDRATALKAMDLVGVNEVYLIVNKYWYQSGRVINETKLTADKWWAIDDGEVYIFGYER